jgi:hypothetical protein
MRSNGKRKSIHMCRIVSLELFNTEFYTNSTQDRFGLILCCIGLAIIPSLNYGINPNKEEVL